MAKHSPLTHELSLPKTLDTEELFNEKGKRVIKDTLALDNGVTYDYYSLKTTDFSVMILASTPDGMWVLNQEYRHPSKQVLLSLPGGMVDEGEAIKKAAEREFLEETGYTAESFECIGTSFPFPGISPQRTYYFKAVNAQRLSEPKLETCELVETTLIYEKEVLSIIQDGSYPIDGHLLTALFFLKNPMKMAI